MTAVNKSNDPDFDVFYNIKDLKDATSAICISLAVHEEDRGRTSSTASEPKDGGRHTRKNRR